jgi:hypothetical protein
MMTILKNYCYSAKKAKSNKSYLSLNGINLNTLNQNTSLNNDVRTSDKTTGWSMRIAMALCMVIADKAMCPEDVCPPLAYNSGRAPYHALEEIKKSPLHKCLAHMNEAKTSLLKYRSKLNPREFELRKKYDELLKAFEIHETQQKNSKQKYDKKIEYERQIYMKKLESIQKAYDEFIYAEGYSKSLLIDKKSECDNEARRIQNEFEKTAKAIFDACRSRADVISANYTKIREKLTKLKDDACEEKAEEMEEIILTMKEMEEIILTMKEVEDLYEEINSESSHSSVPLTAPKPPARLPKRQMEMQQRPTQGAPSQHVTPKGFVEHGVLDSTNTTIPSQAAAPTSAQPVAVEPEAAKPWYLRPSIYNNMLNPAAVHDFSHELRGPSQGTCPQGTCPQRPVQRRSPATTSNGNANPFSDAPHVSPEGSQSPRLMPNSEDGDGDDYVVWEMKFKELEDLCLENITGKQSPSEEKSVYSDDLLAFSDSDTDSEESSLPYSDSVFGRDGDVSESPVEELGALTRQSMYDNKPKPAAVHDFSHEPMGSPSKIMPEAAANPKERPTPTLLESRFKGQTPPPDKKSEAKVALAEPEVRQEPTPEEAGATSTPVATEPETPAQPVAVEPETPAAATDAETSVATEPETPAQPVVPAKPEAVEPETPAQPVVPAKPEAVEPETTAAATDAETPVAQRRAPVAPAVRQEPTPEPTPVAEPIMPIAVLDQTPKKPEYEETLPQAQVEVASTPTTDEETFMDRFVSFLRRLFGIEDPINKKQPIPQKQPEQPGDDDDEEEEEEDSKPIFPNNPGGQN